MSDKEKLRPFGERLAQAMREIIAEDPELSCGAIFLHSNEWNAHYYDTHDMTAGDAMQLLGTIYKSFNLDPMPFLQAFMTLLAMGCRNKDGEPGMPAGGWGEC